MSLQQNIYDALYNRGVQSVDAIKRNITNSGQVSKGKALNSIDKIVTIENDSASLIIGGIQYIKTLETGISPEEARKKDTKTLARLLYGWTINKGGFNFASDRDRWWFSFHSAKRMQTLGSLLFRAGGRTDVYTDESDILMENIINDLGDSVANIKLIK